MPCAKRLLELAVEESHLLGHNYVGTEHLVLGLIQEESVATRVLKNLDVDLSEVRSQIIRLLGESKYAVAGNSSKTRRKTPTLKEEFGVAIWTSIPVNKLTKSESEKLLKIEKTLHSRISQFKDHLIDEGYDPVYGARPLRRAVMRLLEDSLSEEILSERIQSGDVGVIDVDENGKVPALTVDN